MTFRVGGDGAEVDRHPIVGDVRRGSHVAGAGDDQRQLEDRLASPLARKLWPTNADGTATASKFVSRMRGNSLFYRGLPLHGWCHALLGIGRQVFGLGLARRQPPI